MQIDYSQLEQTIKADYRQVTRQYRLDDEIEVTTENHVRLGNRIRTICDSFPHPINVLELGCGTGRYFHCVRNAERLVGLDLSEEMLAAARHPVCEDQIVTPQIELKQGNAYRADFHPGAFHFIFSLGMFGHGCPVTTQLCEKMHRWLAPGGKLLFNIVDFAGLPFCYRLRRQVKAAIYPLLPRKIKSRLDARESRSPFFWMTARKLKHLMQTTRFARFEIDSHACKSPLGNGRHLECLAQKSA